MVDVTILLYLPINTSLDDLAFVADWSQKIVGLAEEKMILNGKNTRYMRQRVMPMMYNPNNNIRPVTKAKTRENTESWLKMLKKQDKEALPCWVKSHNLIDEENEEKERNEKKRIEEEERRAKEKEELEKQKEKEKQEKLEKERRELQYSSRTSLRYSSTLSITSKANSAPETCLEETESSSNRINRKNYLDVIREAVQFTYPVPKHEEQDLSDEDSIFSDACTEDEVTGLALEGREPSSKSKRESQNTKESTKMKQVLNLSVKRKQKQTGTIGTIIGSSGSLESNPINLVQSSQSDLSQHSLIIESPGPISHHIISTNKHVILSVAQGYDRDSMKEVRKVINETGVALLSVGIGDRGMIGLGGYYIKKLSEITSLEQRIVNRLWNLVH